MTTHPPAASAALRPSFARLQSPVVLLGLLAPAHTPLEVVNRIQQETASALKTPELKERLLSQGAIPGGQSPAEFAKFIAAETKKWAQVVKASGAKVD